MAGGPTNSSEYQEAELPALGPEKYDILFNKVSGGKQLSIFTDKEKLVAWIWIQPTSPFFELGYAELEDAVKQTGIPVANEKMVELSHMIRNLKTQQQSGNYDPAAFKPIIIAQGQAPTQGKDGWFEWYIEPPEKGKLRFVPDSHGRINFREMNTVVNVNANDPLVRIHEPTTGAAGVDVFRHAINARNGEAKKITRGKGLRWDEDMQTIYAETSGHVVFEDGSLSVSPIFSVTGNVDFSVGNISFRGSVEVRKDVLEGFSIKATETVLVEGIVQAATIIAGGDVEVRGGITGAGGKGLIETKGRLKTKYLVNTKIEARGDVLVDTQVVNCDLSCAGKLHVPQGKIVGGKVVALGGIEALEIGAELGTRTIVVVSTDEFATTETRSIDAEIDQLDAKRAKIETALGPYLKDRSLLNQLSGEKMELVVGQLKELEEIQQKVMKLQEERIAALAPFEESLSDTIIVHNRIYPGVDIRIDTSRQVFGEKIDGPVKLKPNYQRGTLSLHPV
ncbi:MAG: FapA family protein [Planctomycetes bacterium]|nr:FapA family protein [Planctomycetota bacterium]